MKLVYSNNKLDKELLHWLQVRNYKVDLVDKGEFPYVAEGLGVVRTPALLTEQGDLLYNLNSIKLHIHNYYLQHDAVNLRIDVCQDC